MASFALSATSSSADAIIVVEGSTAAISTSTETVSSVEPTTAIFTSIVTQSATSDGPTNTDAVTVVITSVNSPVTTEIHTLSSGTHVTVIASVAHGTSTISSPGAAGATVVVYGQTQSASQLSGGVIAGIVIGILAAMAIGVGLGYMLLRRKLRPNKDERRDGTGAREEPARYEKDGEDVKELHGQEIRPEADGEALHEMLTNPSELEGDWPREAVEIGMKSPKGTVLERRLPAHLDTRG